MAFAWNVWVVAPLAAAAVGLTLGTFVFVTAPSRPLNRALGALLGGGGLLQSAWALAALADDPATAWAGHYVRFQIWSALIPTALLFLSTIEAPLSAPLRRVQPALVVLPILTWLAWPLWSSNVIGGEMYQGEFWTRWNASSTPSGFIVLDLAALVVAVYGFAIAISQYRAAPPGPTKDRARMYAIAFGVTDAVSILLFGVLTWLWWDDWAAWVAIMPKASAANAGEAVVRFLMAAGWALNAILFGVLFAYASLKTQLFDIDLRIKRGVRRGTLVGAFLAAFLVATAIAQQYLEGYGVVAGGAAVGLMLFAARPIERAADRLADRAMPRVQDTEEYRTVRKREVYRAAVESALEDGDDISPKERGMLATLAEQLGVGPKEMHDIEREARAARAGVAE